MLLILSVLSVTFSVAVSDTPANCTLEDIEGSWVFYETERTGDNTIQCQNTGPVVNKVRVELQGPNIAVDEFGNIGKWTIVYNQGFEVTVNQRVYFAFSKYETHGENVVSYCNDTESGWSHDVTVRNWACFKGKKQAAVKPKMQKRIIAQHLSGRYYAHEDFIRNINEIQNSWVAKNYSQFEGKTHEELLLMRGGRKSRVFDRPHPAPVDWKTLRQIRRRGIPMEFDWRNVNGVNYTPAIRNQGACGSCYAFASMEMIEARIRIMTNNTYTPVFSPQHIVSCSEYSQGCEGGFPYLVAGKFAQDFGLVEERCNPYVAKDGPCHERTCARHYVAKYRYIGDFYGGCNEASMKLSLVRWGPMAVAMEVYDDFMQYSGGIYHHTGLTDEQNPFELTNHAVLLVGYGVDRNTGEKYWIVQNSWGEGWGEDGFFRIRRGTDECAIESLAVEALPIP